MTTMKKYIIMLFVLSVFASCEEFTNSADESKVTFLPKIEMNGSSSVELSCTATGYTDPGVIATEGGDEIEVDKDITGQYFGSATVDGPDTYEISYSAINKDGIPGSSFRSVFWPECNGDMVNSIAGMYKASILRTRPTTGATVNYTTLALGPIFIRDLGNDMYQLSDAIGGFYEYGPNYGYGYHYAATGMVVTANDIPSNDFTHDEIIGVGDFGGELEMTSFSVDAATKTITFSVAWSFNYVFDVKLTQYTP